MRSDSAGSLERALGRLTISYSNFELLLANSCRYMMGLPSDSSESAIMVAGLTAQTLVDKLCALHKLTALNSHQAKLVETFRRAALAAIEKRNRIIHGTWIWSADGKAPTFLFRLSAKGKRGLHVSIEDVKVAGVNSLAKEFGVLLDQVASLPKRSTHDET